MGFFSRLFGRKDKKKEPVTIDEVDEVMESVESDTPIVIDPVVPTDEDNLDDFRMEVFDDEGNILVRATVKGDSGTRIYNKGFYTIDEANDFISTSTTRVMNWVSQGKTLYQAMGYLNMSRAV